MRPVLEAAGFVGWLTWLELRAAAFAPVPTGPGSYLVYRPSAARPELVAPGTGGHYKGRDPNVPLATLQGKWVPGAHTIYFGKGEKLRRRLRTYARFGAGNDKAAHWGGRYIWQLSDAETLLVAWRELSDGIPSARQDELDLLDRFIADHDDRRPFANLTG